MRQYLIGEWGVYKATVTEFEFVPLYKRVQLVISLSFIGDCTHSCLACHSIACVVMHYDVLVLLLWLDLVILYCGMRMKWKSISCSSKRLTPHLLSNLLHCN